MNKRNALFEKAKFILIGYAITVLWILLISLGLKHILIFDYPTPLGIFFFSCILAPLWEELAFRHAPIQIAKGLYKALDVDFTIPIVIISSAIFGWGHGHGPISILMQGVGGLVLSFVYIKNGYSYWSSVIVHFLWNLTMGYLIPNLLN